MIIEVNNNVGFERFKREVIEKKKSCFAMFHMEGCGHCVMLRPEWEKMKKKVGSSLILAEIDSNYSSLVTNLIGGQVTGFPTLMVIKRGRRIKEYNGPRKENEMLEFVRKTFKKVGGFRRRRRRTKKRRQRGGSSGQCGPEGCQIGGRRSRRRRSQRRRSRRRRSRRRRSRRRRSS